MPRTTSSPIVSPSAGRSCPDGSTTRTGDDAPDNLSTVPPDAGPDNPAALKGKGLFAALKRTFKQYSSDNLSDWAAALTYYGVLSIFPGALVVVSLLGMLSSNGQETVQNAVQELRGAGLIATAYRRIVILDRKGLAGFSERGPAAPGG